MPFCQRPATQLAIDRSLSIRTVSEERVWVWLASFQLTR